MERLSRAFRAFKAEPEARFSRLSDAKSSSFIWTFIPSVSPGVLAFSSTRLRDATSLICGTKFMNRSCFPSLTTLRMCDNIMWTQSNTRVTYQNNNFLYKRNERSVVGGLTVSQMFPENKQVKYSDLILNSGRNPG